MMDEIIRDFDLEMGRFVEYRSPFNKKRNIITWCSNCSLEYK
jgi:hypothetical protein